MYVLKGLSRTAESLDGWDGDSALSFIPIIYPGFQCINYLISQFGFWLCGPHILLLHSACPDPDGCFIYSLCWSHLHNSWPHREKKKQTNILGTVAGTNKHTGASPGILVFRGFAGPVLFHCSHTNRIPTASLLPL